MSEMETKLKRAVSAMVPDVLDSVLSDCEEQKGTVIVMNEKKKAAPWVRRLAGLAAAVAILAAGAAGLGIYRNNYAVASTVSLDINPSIEITVNRKEEVLAVVPMNEDGRIVVGDMDFRGSGLDVTVNALIGSMLRNGYLSEIANSILISVDSDDPQQGAALQERLAAEVSNLLQTGSFEGAVLSQTVAADGELETLAETYGITAGKAQLIRQIIAQNPAYTFADLVPLSINELNLLGGSAPLENVTATGSASDKAYIGAAKAKTLALQHAGVTAEALLWAEIDFDYENGAMVYEVEFAVDGCEYDYVLDAVSGGILKAENGQTGDHHSETESHHGTEESAAYLGAEQAKALALEHAGISSASFEKVELDSDGGRAVYEIEFTAGGYEYEYKVDAATGEILKAENEQTGSHHSETDSHHGTEASAAYLGVEQAKALALEHAGVSSASFEKAELDSEDGTAVYEIEFTAGGYEYEYKVDAVSGAIRKAEKERA